MPGHHRAKRNGGRSRLHEVRAPHPMRWSQRLKQWAGKALAAILILICMMGIFGRLFYLSPHAPPWITWAVALVILLVMLVYLGIRALHRGPAPPPALR
jgi:membrane protein YdbS with pleckstrin-like domain